MDKITMREYGLLMKAHKLAFIDKQNDMHWQAWLSVQAGAQKERGKKLVPVYQEYKQFFDYEKELKKAGGRKDDRFSALSKHLKEKQNE